MDDGVEEEPFSPYDPEDHDFMAINIKAMYFSGLWSYHKSGWRYMAYLMYSLFANFVMILISCTYIVEMYTTWGDLPNFAASVWYFNNFVVTVIKHATLLFKMDKVQMTTQKLRGGILSQGLRWSKEHDDICRKTNKMMRSFSMIYYYVGSVSCVGIVILALKSSYYKLYMEFTGATNYTDSDIKMILPCSGWYPFDIQDPTNYLLAFTFQIIPLIVGPITNIGTDTFVSGLIFCACGEFRVLEYSLRTLKRRALQLLQENKDATVWEKPVVRFFENGDETEGLFLHRKEEMDSKLYEALIECIHHHQEILNFVRELEELFSSMMLIQFVSISVRICLNICSILFTKGGRVAQFTYSNMLVVSFLQGLLYCWFGSELTYQSENVSRVLYETPWLEGTYRFRRAILFMVARAQKTLILTGGKIYVMSLETFQSMVYASFSFFRLLQEFGEP